MLEYNRLISEESAPARRRMENRKETGDKEKGKKMPGRERVERD